MKIFSFCLFIGFMAMTVSSFADVHYVNVNGSGLQNGSSWGNAHSGLQAALDAATSGDEIWVKRGTYHPTSSYLMPDEQRNYHFEMKNGVAIIGGFSGNETSSSQRLNYGNGETNETIIDGDFLGNDTFNNFVWTGKEENCYHVFLNHAALAINSSAVLDGFTIANGYSFGAPSKMGAAMVNNDASPTIRNCVFKTNIADDGGGAIYNLSSSPEIVNCSFINNNGKWGGALLYENVTNANISNCQFVVNSAYYNGGAIELVNSTVNASYSTFRGNSCGVFGGAIMGYNTTSIVTNCTFTGNSAENGGGYFIDNSSNTTLINCLFANNNSSNDGGGFCNFSSTLRAYNCTFTRNNAPKGGGIFTGGAGINSSLYNCIVWGNTGNQGYEFYGDAYLYKTCFAASADHIIGVFMVDGCINSDPLFISSDDFRIRYGSPCRETAFLDYYTTASGPEYDLWGNLRTIGSALDMGAYEYCLPTLTTSPVLFITESSAQSGGTITNFSNVSIYSRGLCWNTTGSPTIDDNKTEDFEPFSSASFIAQPTGLQANTIYYLRAYADCYGGIGYGNELTFTTIPTLGQWGLIAFGSLIAVIGGAVVWRRFV